MNQLSRSLLVEKVIKIGLSIVSFLKREVHSPFSRMSRRDQRVQGDVRADGGGRARQLESRSSRNTRDRSDDRWENKGSRDRSRRRYGYGAEQTGDDNKRDWKYNRSSGNRSVHLYS